MWVFLIKLFGFDQLGGHLDMRANILALNKNNFSLAVSRIGHPAAFSLWPKFYGCLKILW